MSWLTPGSKDGKGRILQSSRDQAMARNFSCSFSYSMSDSFATFVPGSTTVPMGNTVTFGTFLTYASDSDSGSWSNINDPCSGAIVFAWSSGFVFHWSSDNTSIASISGSNSGTSVSMVANTGGTTTVHVSATDNYDGPCEIFGGAQITVQVPTSLSVVSVSVLPTGSSGDYGCTPSKDYGIMVDIKYQVRDQNGNALRLAGMVPYEHVVFSDGAQHDGNIGPTYVSTNTGTTASDGTFHDAPLGICSPLPINSNLTLMQDVSVILNGAGFPVRSQTFTVSDLSGASGFDHGPITNGSDVSASR